MNAYKLFMLDIGLLGAMSELEATSILEGNEIFAEFKGALTEQYVLQQLVSDIEYSNRKKKTKREEFLDAMEEIIPWSYWVEMIRPFYFDNRRG